MVSFVLRPRPPVSPQDARLRAGRLRRIMVAFTVAAAMLILAPPLLGAPGLAWLSVFPVVVVVVLSHQAIALDWWADGFEAWTRVAFEAIEQRRRDLPDGGAS